MRLPINKNFIVSTTILVVGVLMLIGSVTNPSSMTTIDDSLPGLCMILGALAYRSAKQRKLKLVQNTRNRKVFEFLALILIAVLILIGPDILQMIQDGDIITLVILVWAILAYLSAVPKGMATQNKEAG